MKYDDHTEGCLQIRSVWAKTIKSMIPTTAQACRHRTNIHSSDCN